MKKIALIATTIALSLAALLVSSPAASAAATSPRPFPHGHQSGAMPSWLTAPSTAVRPPVSVALAPVTCDGQFDVVASPSGTGDNILVSTAAISPNDVWAVGNSVSTTGFDRALAEHWNGSTWSIIAVPLPTSLHSDLTGVSAIATNDVWAVGVYEVNTQGVTHTFAEHWNGTSWTLTTSTVNPTPFSILFAVAAVSSTDVWAVGTFDSAGLLPMVEHWNGTTWSWDSTVPNPSPSDNELFAISAWSSTDIWAVGEFSGNGSGTTPLMSLAYHWNGIAWSLITTPNLGPAGANNEILGVTALEGGHAVGVGYGNFVSGSTPRRGEAWDLVATGVSTSLYEIGPGAGDNALLAVDRSGGSVWAVGYWRSTATSARETLAIPATWDSAGHTLTWSIAPGTSASPSPTNNVLFAVAAISPSVFWATGWMQSGTVAKTLTELYCGVHFNLVAPVMATVGAPFSLTVTAANANQSTATGYLGTVHFTSSDSLAVLPGDHTFIPGDSGVHTFNGVILNSPYSRTITVNDTLTPFVMGSVAINVVCLGACQSPAGTPGSRDANQSPSVPPPGIRLPTSRAASKARIGVQAVLQQNANKSGLVRSGDGMLVSPAAHGSTQAAQSAWTLGLASPIRLIMFALRALGW
jgi:hypothetical protein